MDRLIYTAMTGASTAQHRQTVLANNLANVSTNGFKRATAVFEDLMYQNLRQVGANTAEQAELPTGLQVGLGVRTVATSRNFTQGSLQQSGNALDLAVNGGGFFQVQMPDGTTGYTRDGSFQLDAQGRMVTSSGYPLTAGITLPAESQSITVSSDGVVTAKLPGNPVPQQVGNIELANFINAAGLEPLGQNLFAESLASGNPITGAPGSTGLGTVMQGMVETSNVNVVQELVTMIQTQRAYEMNSKAIQTSDQMLQRLSQL